MPTVEVIGLEEVQQLLNDMPEVGKRTMSTSINKTATHVRSVVSQTVRTFSTVKASYAKASMLITKKATVNSLNSTINISGEQISLIGYQTSQTKKGVKARIFKSGSLTLRPHSFIAEMKSGHKGVFWRDYRDDGSGRLVKRLGITELKDYSIPDLVDDDRVWEDLQEDADDFLMAQIEKNYNYYMEKYK